MSFVKTCSLYFSIFTAVSWANELPLEGTSPSSLLPLNMTTINSESADKEPAESVPSSPISGREQTSSSPSSPSSPRSSRKIRVLALDGGGTRGIVEAIILEEIEKQTGKKIHEVFDLIVATSTGSLIGAGLVYPKPPSEQDPSPILPYSATEIVQLYKEAPKKIFSKPYRIASYLRKTGINGTLYDHKPAQETFKNLYGSKLLSEAVIPFGVTAHRVTDKLPHFFSSIHAQENPFKEEINLPVWKVISAATAAPNYFEAVEIGDIKIADGGVSHNNPVCKAINYACDYFEAKPWNLAVLSLGTGIVIPNTEESFYNASAISWAQHIIEANLAGEKENLDACERIRHPKKNALPEKHGCLVRIQHPLPSSLSELDHYSEQYFKQLEEIAHKTLQQENIRRQLDSFIDTHLKR